MINHPRSERLFENHFLWLQTLHFMLNFNCRNMSMQVATPVSGS